MLFRFAPLAILGMIMGQSYCCHLVGPVLLVLSGMAIAQQPAPAAPERVPSKASGGASTPPPIVSQSPAAAAAVRAASTEATYTSSEAGYEYIVSQAEKLAEEKKATADRIKNLREQIAFETNRLVGARSPEEREALVRLDGSLGDAKTTAESASYPEARRLAMRGRIAASIESLAPKPPAAKRNPAPSASK